MINMNGGISMRKKGAMKALAAILAAATVCGGVSTGIQAKEVMPQLNHKKVTIEVADTKKIKIKNVVKAKVKSVTWKVNKKGSSIVELSKKSKFFEKKC